MRPADLAGGASGRMLALSPLPGGIKVELKSVRVTSILSRPPELVKLWAYEPESEKNKVNSKASCNFTYPPHCGELPIPTTRPDVANRDRAVGMNCLCDPNPFVGFVSICTKKPRALRYLLEHEVRDKTSIARLTQPEPYRFL